MMEYTINRPLAFYAPINIHNDAHTLIHISHSHIGIRQICRLNHKQYRHTELNNTIAIKINYAMCLFCQVYSKHTQRQLQLRVCVCKCVPVLVHRLSSSCGASSSSAATQFV